MSFVIIPARLPPRACRKPLQDINGKPIVHGLERARESGADRISSPPTMKMSRVRLKPRAAVCMTRADHQSGTERLASLKNSFQR